MTNIKLSGGQYGGYILNDITATLSETKLNENNEQYNEVIDSVVATVVKNIINIDGWVYDTDRSADKTTAEFIGMA